MSRLIETDATEFERHRSILEAWGSPTSIWAAHQLEAMQAEIERLKAEIVRLRNIMNEDGLHDPELAKLAGKHRDALEASTDKGGRKFRASLDNSKVGEK